MMQVTDYVRNLVKFTNEENLKKVKKELRTKVLSMEKRANKKIEKFNALSIKFDNTIDKQDKKLIILDLSVLESEIDLLIAKINKITLA